ncbi:hypothetical protein [Belnapia rosea]|uniref:Cytochrome C and Quinol oxidase polypeptide I n=1 Tax=Belnapia rosea TaxID=938405 RepID=A0A1G6XPU1_9PROT|nr:hypothetical protein [Belnapia rosea]SDB69934.1 hypothetical protein SAMN02927895_03603 [Belnapia rosea]SDD79387.1 hypothetical protein SAMN04487779_1012114 [Belnapia rosea]
MSRLPALFLIAAALCLVVGTSLGIAMGIAHDFHLAPVHAHLNLVGWTTLALMGLSYRAWPQLAESRLLAPLQFFLSAGSAVAFPAGIYLSIEHEAPGLAIGAALVFFASTLLFLLRLLPLVLARQPAARMVVAE